MSVDELRHLATMTFWTPSGVDVAAVTTDQMREIDRIAMEETGPNLFQMMENAGRNLAEMAMECLGANWRKARIVVLAGTGGNGGGGIAAARHLANHGAHVELCLAAPEKLGEIAAWQRKVFRSTTGREVPPRDLDNAKAVIIVDALIGYGLQSARSGMFADLIVWANNTGAPILSLDVPYGRDTRVVYPACLDNESSTAENRIGDGWSRTAHACGYRNTRGGVSAYRPAVRSSIW